MKEIGAIVFDLFGVNIHRDEWRTLNALAALIGKTTDETREGLANAGTPELAVGKIEPDAFVERLGESAQRTITAGEFEKAWKSAAPHRTREETGGALTSSSLLLVDFLIFYSNSEKRKRKPARRAYLVCDIKNRNSYGSNAILQLFR